MGAAKPLSLLLSFEVSLLQAPLMSFPIHSFVSEVLPALCRLLLLFVESHLISLREHFLLSLGGAFPPFLIILLESIKAIMLLQHNLFSSKKEKEKRETILTTQGSRLFLPCFRKTFLALSVRPAHHFHSTSNLIPPHEFFLPITLQIPESYTCIFLRSLCIIELDVSSQSSGFYFLRKKRRKLLYWLSLPASYFCLCDMHISLSSSPKHIVQKKAIILL